jgi:hypothetical protein
MLKINNMHYNIDSDKLKYNQKMIFDFLHDKNKNISKSNNYMRGVRKYPNIPFSKYHTNDDESNRISIKNAIEIHNYFVDKYFEIITIFNRFVIYFNKINDGLINHTSHKKNQLKELKEFVNYTKIIFDDYDMIPDDNILCLITLMHNNMKDIYKFSSEITNIISNNLSLKSTHELMQEIKYDIKSNYIDWKNIYYRQMGGNKINVASNNIDDINNSLKKLNNMFEGYDKINDILKYIQDDKIISSLNKIKKSYEYHTNTNINSNNKLKKKFKYFDYTLPPKNISKLNELHLNYDLNENPKISIDTINIEKLLDEKYNLLHASNKNLLTEIKYLTEKYNLLYNLQLVDYHDDNYTFINISNNYDKSNEDIDNLIIYTQKKKEINMLKDNIKKYQSLLSLYDEGKNIINTINDSIKNIDSELFNLNIKKDLIMNEYKTQIINILGMPNDNLIIKFENLNYNIFKINNITKTKKNINDDLTLKTKKNINDIIKKMHDDKNLDKINTNIKILSQNNLFNKKLEGLPDVINLNFNDNDNINDIFINNNKILYNNYLITQNKKSNYNDWYEKYKKNYEEFINSDFFNISHKNFADHLILLENKLDIYAQKIKKYSSLDTSIKDKINNDKTLILNNAVTLNEQLFNTIIEMNILINDFNITSDKFNLTNDELIKIKENDKFLINHSSLDIFNQNGGYSKIYNKLNILNEGSYTYIQKIDEYITIYIKTLKINRINIYHSFFKLKVYKDLGKITNPYNPSLYLSYDDIIDIYKKINYIKNNNYLNLIIDKYIVMCENLIIYFGKKKDEFLYIDHTQKSFNDLLFLIYLGK